MRINEILEGITIDPSQQLKFNYSDPAGVSTRLGKNKFVPYLKKDKTLDGYSVYSVYSSGADTTTDVLKSIKKKSDIKVSDQDYNHFINRTAVFITSKILLPNKIDCIVTPRSSTNILNDLLKQIQARNPHIEFFPESFIKTVDLSKIEIDYDNPKISPGIIRSLTSILNKSMKTGNFEIKKALPQNRKFFRNFFEIVDPKIFAKFQNKNICVIDDVLSSGTTLLEIMKTIASYNPTSVIGTSIYKTE